MEKLYISPTSTTPEVKFSPEENVFFIRGTSSPEDVRTMYYPVIEWIRGYSNLITNTDPKLYSTDNPLRLTIDLEYFNSSSAKFLFDILHELKLFIALGITVIVDWYYEEEDTDMKEAGYDISLLLEMEFHYISK